MTGRYCRTGKRIYFEERLVVRAMWVARGRAEMPAHTSWYKCPRCAWWHLTTKPTYDPRRRRALFLSHPVHDEPQDANAA